MDAAVHFSTKDAHKNTKMLTPVKQGDVTDDISDQSGMQATDFFSTNPGDSEKLPCFLENSPPPPPDIDSDSDSSVDDPISSITQAPQGHIKLSRARQDEELMHGPNNRNTAILWDYNLYSAAENIPLQEGIARHEFRELDKVPHEFDFNKSTCSQGVLRSIAHDTTPLHLHPNNVRFRPLS